MRYFIAAVLIATLAAGCADPAAPNPNSPTLATLRGAPPSAHVNGQTIVLKTDLWRDMSPVVTPTSTSMIAVFVVSTSDSATAPAVTLDAAWVINGSQVWTPVLEDDPLVDPYPNTIFKIARNGPQWPVGTVADVVVRVKDAAGHAYLIRVTGETVFGAY